MLGEPATSAVAVALLSERPLTFTIDFISIRCGKSQPTQCKSSYGYTLSITAMPCQGFSLRRAAKQRIHPASTRAQRAFPSGWGKMESTMTPRNLFRLFATAEVITWAGLIAALILRATGVTDGAVRIAGGIHGFIFLAYGVTTVFVWVNQRWRVGTGITGLLLAVVPFATYPFERSLDRRGLLAGPWRLRPGGDAPAGFVEHVQAWILRRPILAITLIVILIVLVFVTLLWLGPPIPKG